MGLYRDNGKDNGNYCYIIYKVILGCVAVILEYWDNGKENGNYYIIIAYIQGLYRDSGAGVD